MDDGVKQADRSRLRPELVALLEAVAASGAKPLHEMAALEGRADSEINVPRLWGEVEPVAAIEDLTIATPAATLPVRIYRPEGARGTILFFHGGGWVLGSIATHDGGSRALANRTPANLVSVEYRKGPEARFPAAVTDADASLDWLLANGPALGLDTGRLIVAGESAGGTLAAVVARHARDRGIRLAGQALIYPPTDPGMGSASYRRFESGFNLTAAAMRWFYDHYVDPADRTHPDAAPLLAEDLSGLAPALVLNVDHDPLHDEACAYAARLMAAGNDVDYREVKGTIHGAWVMNGVTPACGELIGTVARWARARLG